MKRYALWALFLVIAVGHFAFLVNRTPGITWDDALITLTYADNLAQEGDFFYNQDDGVDGFTSTLDVLVKAFAIVISPLNSLDTAIVVTAAYGLLVVLACIAIVFKLTRETPQYQIPIAMIAIVLVSSSHELADATVTGLEAPLFVCLALLAVFFQPLPSQKTALHIAWSFLLLAVLMARPEGLVVVFLTCLYYLWIGYSQGDRNRAIAIVAFSWFLIISYFVWRIIKFGHWAPNTYYAKSSATRTAEIFDGLQFVFLYAERSTFNLMKLILLALSPILILVNCWKNQDARWRYMSIVALAGALVAAVIWSGGDSYLGSGRLLAMPLTLLMFMPLLVINGATRRVQIIAVGVLCFLAAGNLWHSYKAGRRAPKPSLIAYANQWLDCRGLATERLMIAIPEVPLGQTDAQFVKYFDRSRPVIDLHGLNNREIAHSYEEGHVTFGKYSQARGIEANAEIYVYGYHLFTEEPMTDYTLPTILNDKELMEHFIGYQLEGSGPYISPPREVPTADQIQTLSDRYVPVSIRLEGCENDIKYFNVLLRKDLINIVQPHEWVTVNAN